MGIDPGLKGALAISHHDDPIKSHLLEGMEYIRFREIIHEHGLHHIFLEKAQAMPKQGVTSMFNYGVGFGKLIGWIESLMIPFTLITPQMWTKELHKGATGKDSKAKSLQVAQRLFPEIDFRATERCKKPHMGLVDAVLIAEYGRRVHR
jgi:crossover junction endodeoxyribonuclease RuvC